MRVINIHKRTINQPKAKIAELLKTLASNNDRMLATDKWSPMILDRGLQEGSKGGHGRIKYVVQKYVPEHYIQFRFSEMKGFEGFHKFEMTEVEKNVTELKHTIDLKITGTAILLWSTAIRWLHDAYIEDAFDNVENNFTTETKSSSWSLWVKVLRKVFMPNRK